MVILECLDLQSVSKAIDQDKLYDSLYETPIGSIAPIDIIYGLRSAIQNGNEYMAHKCGFTYFTLLSFFINVGSKKWIGGRRPEDYALYLIACKGEKTDSELSNLAAEFLP